MRPLIAREIGARRGRATGPTCLLLPSQGIEAWDRPGEPLHDDEGLQAFLAAMREAVPAGTPCVLLDAHINDAAFCDAALQVFDHWVARGWVPPGQA